MKDKGITPRGTRLLVVDDNEMNRDMLSRRLLREGHDVAVAVDGREALDLLRRDPFDLVLLDIMMPQVDGFQVLTELKSDDSLRHIPVVMISASEETASVVRCIELGAEDYLPKPFNPVILKARVEASLEKKRLRDQERMWARSLERELEIGRQIQEGFFPEALPRFEGWEIAALFRPARQVAGDFYDAFEIGGRVGLVMADVCDKGVGAALYMALFRSLIRALAGQEQSRGATAPEVVSRTVAMTNDYIARTHGSSNMFATAFFGILDIAAGTIHYINGGHEPPIIRRARGGIDRLVPTGPALGMLPGLPFALATERIGEGDLLLAFTDGVTEARGASGFFGEDRLLEMVTEPGEESTASLLERIERSVIAHAGSEEQSDDLTMLAVRRTRP